MTTTEAEALQLQIDTLTTTIETLNTQNAQLQTRADNLETNNSAMIETLTEGGSTRNMIDANTAANAIPADGQELDTGQTFEGRKVFRRSTSSTTAGAIADGGTPTVLFDDVYQVTAWNITMHILGSSGSFQVTNVYYDENTDFVGVYADVNSGEARIVDWSTTDNVQSYWGNIEYVKVSNP